MILGDGSIGDWEKEDKIGPKRRKLEKNADGVSVQPRLQIFSGGSPHHHALTCNAPHPISAGQGSLLLPNLRRFAGRKNIAAEAIFSFDVDSFFREHHRKLPSSSSAFNSRIAQFAKAATSKSSDSSNYKVLTLYPRISYLDTYPINTNILGFLPRLKSYKYCDFCRGF